MRLRYLSPIQLLFRRATEDTEIVGHAIPKDAIVMPIYASANRDEAVFQNADQLDVQRPDLRKHVAFGWGIHVCVGKALAGIGRILKRGKDKGRRITMHLGYLEAMRDADLAPLRRTFLKRAGAVLLSAGLGTAARADDAPRRGFKGEGRMNRSTGEDWIDTFFTGGAAEIIHYYADEFVFEDVTLFQTISNKDDLYRAFLPFDNAGPDAPAGVHQFDIIRYDGGLASNHRGVKRADIPENYTPELWSTWSAGALAGIDYDYDEWAVMNWVWKATHNMDFLELPAKGKTTHARGITFHAYKNRKIVGECTYWCFRSVAIQLGAFKPQEKFWLPKA